MDQNTKKQRVAEAVLDYITNGESLGIGSGSTVNILIENLHKVKTKIRNVVSSSVKSTELLKANGFEVSELRDVGKLTKYIDGADEVNKDLQMIKGGGGALTREKILAHASEKFICIVDDSKRVEILGTFPLPIEVIPFAEHSVRRNLGKMSEKITKRSVSSDSGNIILDMHGMLISDPEKMEAELISVPGIVEVGIFAKNKPTSIKIGRDSYYESIDC